MSKYARYYSFIAASRFLEYFSMQGKKEAWKLLKNGKS